MKKTAFALGLFLILAMWVSRWHRRREETPLPEPPTASPRATAAPSLPPQRAAAPALMPTPVAMKIAAKAPAAAIAVKKNKPEEADRTVPFVVEDGVAVTQGDLVLGKPAEEVPDDKGYADAPQMHLWPTNDIPFAIDSSVTRPERVEQALAFFNGTPVHFVPLTNQKDGIVFMDATGVCKSYVGHIGGLQPVWIPAGCEPKEIAHEIMHALGFVHEQNRTDRDRYIAVLNDNIDEKYKENFEKMPADWMQASGLSTFDFESIMMYPAWMFAKGGKSTMESKIPDRQIRPDETLSPLDFDRLRQAYGSRNPPADSQ